MMGYRFLLDWLVINIRLPIVLKCLSRLVDILASGLCNYYIIYIMRQIELSIIGLNSIGDDNFSLSHKGQFFSLTCQLIRW